MPNLLGEYHCKADEKGRVLFPSDLRKQLPEEARDTLVINRGFEKCLVLYPINEWEKIQEKIEQLNPFKKKNREFKRFFNAGAERIPLDNSSRIRIPRRLMNYAGLKKDIVLFAHSNKIEIWDKDQYEDLIDSDPEDFAELAEQVMGNQENGDDDQS